MDSSPSLITLGRDWLSRRALFFKVLGLAFLGLLLLIPLAMVDATRSERFGRYQEAVAEITRTWGGAQRVVGPVLVVPFVQRTEVEEWTVNGGQRLRQVKVLERSGEAWFLPERLEVSGEVAPLELRRGIYRTTVHTSTLRLAGRFARPEFAALGLPDLVPQWERARLGLALSDLRGVQGEVELDWGGRGLVFESGSRLAGLGTGLHRALDLRDAPETLAFSVNVAVNGSDGLTFVPVGRQTEVALRSPWPSPGFIGGFLPVERTVETDGFSARWRVSHHARSFPQQAAGWEGGSPFELEALGSSAFGVRLLDTVTAYRAVERAIKHGVLFITVVFASFFLLEALGGRRLQALHYLLVGAALCLFYLALLALSEFVTFGWAYGGAALASTVLIASYARSVLGGLKPAVVIGAMLGTVYGYLFMVVRLEDFALLAGTAGLFVLLAAVMAATRRLATPPAEAAA